MPSKIFHSSKKTEGVEHYCLQFILAFLIDVFSWSCQEYIFYLEIPKREKRHRYVNSLIVKCWNLASHCADCAVCCRGYWHIWNSLKIKARFKETWCLLKASKITSSWRHQGKRDGDAAIDVLECYRSVHFRFILFV